MQLSLFVDTDATVFEGFVFQHHMLGRRDMKMDMSFKFDTVLEGDVAVQTEVVAVFEGGGVNHALLVGGDI